MTKKIILLMLLIGSLAAGSLVWESDLIFSHKFHHEDAEAACETCHEAALTSVKGADDLLPAMQTCFNCHDENTECTFCHKQPDEPKILPRVTDYSPMFSHKLHAEQGVACVTCHDNITTKETAESGMHLPVMDNCMTCHKTPETVEGCYDCHQKGEELEPVSHTTEWEQAHGVYAESGAENCKSCHTETYCVECHQGENLNNQSHPAEFIATHSISFMTGEQDCAGCHDRQDFCVTCHVEINRVVPANHSTADWIGVGHSAAARIEFDKCAVCHIEGDVTCIRCHN
jgi:hypothetical protein